MFGKNVLSKTTYRDAEDDESLRVGKTLLVNSVFYTIQGEGPRAGQPAVFLRLQGCNLRCYFCDTEFELGRIFGIDEIIEQIEAVRPYHTSLVVITGGEPLRQNVVPLCMLLLERGLTVQFETAGTVCPPRFDSLPLRDGKVEIVCSPKTPKIHATIAYWCKHYKYIVSSDDVSELDGLPLRCTQTPEDTNPPYRPIPGRFQQVTVWVQPCDVYDRDANALNVSACRDVALKHGYRVSLQTHKTLGVN